MFQKKLCKKKLCAMLLATTMMATAFHPWKATEKIKAQDLEVMDQLTQDEIVADMGAGWNLGNTMEAFGDYGPNEQNWGNPTVTPELLKAVKAAGFSTVRMPISLLKAIGPAPDYKINESWMKRIKEVVDYAYSIGLYVIVDGVHGDGYHTIDGAWLLITEEDQKTIKDKYAKIWSQYAEMFKDYDEHIIFESMNEVFDGNYYDPDAELYQNLNAYNQVFVDTVRKSGGNNASRWLLVPGWNTNIDHMTLDFGFKVPADNYRDEIVPGSEQRLMISAHYYTPYEFCLDNDSPITQWGKIAKDKTRTSTWGQEDYLDSQMKQMYDSFITKGYPVVIGEYCATDKSKKDPTNLTYRAYFAEKMSETCKKYGAVACYWDIGAKEASCLIDRKTYEIYTPEVVDAIMKGLKTTERPAIPTPVPTKNVMGNPAKVSVLYKCTSTDDTAGAIRFNIDVRNDDTVPVRLSDVRIRYWYNRDDGKWQSFNCYYALIGCQNVWANMARIPLSQAYEKSDFYCEIGFGYGAGTLAPGESTGQIQITLTKYDNSSYNQTNDHSFQPELTEYDVNKYMTAYVNGNQVAGEEPSGKVPVITTQPIESVEPTESSVPAQDVKPCVDVETKLAGSVNQTYTITSLGSQAIDLSKLAIRFYYSKTGNKEQTFWCDNAGLQKKVSPYYCGLTSDVRAAFHKDYVEITFDTADILLSKGEKLVLGTRFGQSDWSAFDDFKENGYFVYYDGIQMK